ncbi:MAG: hypothetical protein K2V38_19885 [Gemmataceae bacterium]|nr:hypothetical protein [Gemmataceae bacterium]
MATDGSSRTHAFAYCTGWHAVGCAVLFFGLLGSIAVSLIPAGIEKVQAGQLPTGVAMIVMGVFGVPTLFMALKSLYQGIRNAVRPPRIQLTETALFLPREARGDIPVGEHGEALATEPPHPSEIPLTAIRAIKREGLLHSQTLEITHSLSDQPLKLHRHMMWAADFDELEGRLRAALSTRPTSAY